MKNFVGVIVLIVSLFFGCVWGHGFLFNPAGRSSRWRVDPLALANYDDNQNYCGGLTVQHHKNGGRCGLCGDDYASPTPRENELGGKYGGSGVIVRSYKGDIAEVEFIIENNHLGYVYFELCNLSEFKHESEECFAKYHLPYTNGSDKLYVGRKTGSFKASLVLPTGVKCEHCVLRWTYLCGNNWNPCPDGEGNVGCGPQETFKNCADIRID